MFNIKVPYNRLMHNFLGVLLWRWHSVRWISACVNTDKNKPNILHTTCSFMMALISFFLILNYYKIKILNKRIIMIATNLNGSCSTLLCNKHKFLKKSKL